MSDTIPEELQSFREQIDALDAELIDLLARRFEIVRKVGNMKAERNIPVVQSDRAELVKARNEALAVEKDIPEGFVYRVYEMMIDEAHVIEHEIAAQKKDRL